jgi:hypothetical protein
MCFIGEFVRKELFHVGGIRGRGGGVGGNREISVDEMKEVGGYYTDKKEN